MRSCGWAWVGNGAWEGREGRGAPTAGCAERRQPALLHQTGVQGRAPLACFPLVTLALNARAHGYRYHRLLASAAPRNHMNCRPPWLLWHWCLVSWPAENLVSRMRVELPIIHRDNRISACTLESWLPLTMLSRQSHRYNHGFAVARRTDKVTLYHLTRGLELVLCLALDCGTRQVTFALRRHNSLKQPCPYHADAGHMARVERAAAARDPRGADGQAAGRYEWLGLGLA